MTFGSAQQTLDLEFADHLQLQSGLFHGLFSSAQLVSACIARIEEVDGKLHSVVQINHDAWSDARRIDKSRQAKPVSEATAGISGLPILVKDMFAVLPPLCCTAGSTILLDTVPAREAKVIAEIQQRGGIILGLTNMTEWAFSRCKTIPAQHWSARGGALWSRHCADTRLPSSSGGSACAVDAGFAFAALGTQTWGSQVKPAARCNIVGVRSSAGLCPTDGLVSRGLMSSVGVFARTVADAAVLLSACAGTEDYLAECRHQQTRSFRIGIPNTYLGFNVDRVKFWRTENAGMLAEDAEKRIEDAAFRIAVADLAAIGNHIEHSVDFIATEEQYLAALDEAAVVISTDFRESFTDWLRNLEKNPKGIKTLEDVIQAIKDDPNEDWPARDVEVYEDLVASTISSASPSYVEAKQRCLWLGTEGTVVGALERYSLDCLAMPAYAAYQLADLAGLPQIVVPCGFYPDDAKRTLFTSTPVVYNTGPGMPIGICFVGRAHSENKLFAIAHAYEQATQWRSKGKPLFRATTQV